MWTNAIMTVLIGVLFIIKPHDSLKVIAIIAGILILCRISIWFVIQNYDEILILHMERYLKAF